MAIELVHEIGRRTSHHPGHQRNSLSISTPVHSSAAGECGLLIRCSLCSGTKPLQSLFSILLSFYVRGFVLVGKKIIIIIEFL